MENWQFGLIALILLVTMVFAVMSYGALLGIESRLLVVLRLMNTTVTADELGERVAEDEREAADAQRFADEV